LVCYKIQLIFLNKILQTLEKLIELNGELYLDNFKNTRMIRPLNTRNENGYYVIYDMHDTNKNSINKQTLIDEYDLLNCNGYYKVLFNYQYMYNFCDLFKFMDKEGRIPADKILEHVENLDNEQIENRRFIVETLSMINTIFDPLEYKIEYINDGCYPNESNRDETLVKNYFVIKKIKDTKPLKNIVKSVDQIVLPETYDEPYMKQIVIDIEMLQKDKFVLNINLSKFKTNVPLLQLKFDYFHDLYIIYYSKDYPLESPYIYINGHDHRYTCLKKK